MLFGRPFYQALATHDRTRDVPDVSYNAAVFHGVIVAWEGDFWLFGGTSAGSPQWAGLVADADQFGRHRMGNIDPALYSIAQAKKQYAATMHDITTGNNDVAEIDGGFNAGPGGIR